MREPAATTDHPWEDRKARPKEHFSLPQTDARAARASLDQLLADGAPNVAAALPAGFGIAVEAYVDLLLEANRRLNLTRLTDPDEVARLHLLDALAALPIITEAPVARALDLGSGGGVPGIVLALAMPQTHWALVDSVRRKADALAAFVAALPLDATVIAERAELLGRGEARASFDLVTARACAALPVLVEYALPLLREGGRLLAWKGPISEDELAGGEVAAALLGGGRPVVRPTGIEALGDHRFVIIAKERSTPERYPRRPGQPSRRPLGSRGSSLPDR
jgi:16S rRNA (guanine527-N7)-methyltransferase